MIEVVDTFLDFLVRYPVLPALFFVYCSACAVPIVILLIAVQKCALHRNCRYLITFWCISLLGELSNVVLLNAENLVNEKGYIPRGIIDPPLRPYFLIFHSTFYASGSCFEMLIAFERILSTREPHVYHVSGVYWALLVPLTISVYCLGTYIGYTIYIVGNHISGLMIYNAIDISTLVINTFGIRYCKARYESLYGKASLNARYQVSEAYDMACAMHPVYFVSFLLKVFGMIIAYTYILLMPYFNTEIYALMDAGYFLAHSFNCAFSSVFLMFLHKPIRKSVLTLLGSKRVHEVSISAYDKRTAEATDKYFSLLEDSWK